MILIPNGRSIARQIFYPKLGTKAAAVICLFIAWLNKSLIAWLYTDLEGDKSLYLLFSKSFLEGRSFVETVKLAESGLHAIVFDPAITSPMYSLIAVPLIYTTHSYFATSVIIDLFAWALLLTGLYKTARSLFETRWNASLFILFVGFFLLPHEMESPPKDTLAIGFLFWACYTIHLLITRDKGQLKLALLLMLLLFSIALTKYLYSPLALLLLIILLFYAFRQNNKALLFISLSIALIVIVFFYWFNEVWLVSLKKGALIWEDLPSDGTTFKKGFYPSNIEALFPFLTSSFLNTNFWGVQLSNIFKTSFANIMRIFQFFDLLLFIGLGLLLRKNRSHLTKVTLVVLFFVCCFIVSTLIYMSLRHESVYFKASSGVGNGWTYVAEPRSYILPILSIDLLAFYLIFKSSILNRGLSCFLMLLFVCEGLHGCYFSTKQLFKAVTNKEQKNAATPIKKITNDVIQLMSSNPNTALLTSDAHLRRYAVLNGINTFTFSNRLCRGKSLPDSCVYVIAVMEPDSLLATKGFPSSQLQRARPVPPFLLYYYKTKW